MAGDRLFARDLAVLAPDALHPHAPHPHAPHPHAPHPHAPHPHAPQVDLRLSRSPDGATYLAQQRVAYPFHIGRSLFMPGDPAGMPTLYVQSCAGGIFEHDRLAWRVVAEAGCSVHLTGSASTIVHSMASGEAVQDVTIEAHAGTFVEYMPDPLVLFSDARLTSRLAIVAHADASVIACDGIVPHDPKGGERPFGWIDSQLHLLAPDGTLLARDRYRLPGELLAAAVPGITGGYRCMGSFIAVTGKAAGGGIAASMRERVHGLSGAYASASTLPGGCGAWLRVLAQDACALREALRLAWFAARAALLGTQPAPRRK